MIRKSFHRRRHVHPSVTELAGRGGVLADLSPAELRRIEGLGIAVTLPEGWTPIRRNTPSDKAYILLSGEVSIRHGDQEVARLGPGDIVGEASFVRHQLRSATVVTLTPVAALHYTPEAVDTLCAEVPAFRQRLEDVAAERIGDRASH